MPVCLEQVEGVAVDGEEVCRHWHNPGNGGEREREGEREGGREGGREGERERERERELH